jgi:CDP-glycerol glycerophosphotransferase (TagB/SpsB family)
VIPKNPTRCVFTSFPDFSDNAYALYAYMQANAPASWTFVWLVEDRGRAEKKRSGDVRAFAHRVRIVPKRSLWGIWNYLRAGYVFFTHGLYNGVSISGNHIVVNLWHGMPLKSICHLDPNCMRPVPRSTFCIATSPVFADIIARAFGVSSDRVLLTGLPRNDALLEASGSLMLNGVDLVEAYERIIMWMPTYRSSCRGEVRTDGEPSDFIPCVTHDDLRRLNDLFQRHHCYGIVKLHPMDTHFSLPLSRYSNLAVLGAADFDAQGLSLYRVLARTDVLITDYSSVFIDYLLLDRPMFFCVPDADRYRQTRGFVFKDANVCLPGEQIDSFSELFEKMQQYLVTGTDGFKNERARVKEMFHSVQKGFCRSVYEQVVGGEQSDC